MSERRSSLISSLSRSTSGPPITPKPKQLRGKEYLKENLLGDYEPADVSFGTPSTTGSVARTPVTPRYDHDVEMQDDYERSRHRLVIAVDYGTTFTGVAFATPRFDDANLDDIIIVDDWGAKMGNQEKIPSIFSYSPAPNGEEQWGLDIAEDAVTMVNTKMELDVQDDKIDELELVLQVLNGTCNLDFENVKAQRGYPKYPVKSPDQVVTDFLSKVFQHLSNDLEHFGSHLRALMPVDLVITVPVQWSYQAQNSTIRAMTKAGFNEESFPNLRDIILVTEPEAAAIYTARYLKKDKKKDFLKIKEYFVLCDAGGGTVDVVAYKVVQLEPNLELEQATIPTSLSFVKTLHCKITGKLTFSSLLSLDPNSRGQQISAHAMEGKEMRLVMKKFEMLKKTFSGTGGLLKLDLPGSLSELNIPRRVTQGELSITSQEMKGFFDPCVDSVVELIQSQIQQVEGRNNRVKNVFLVGGFGESPFLQRELESSLKLRNIVMRHPEKSKAWTAVVQGAVIYGIEKASHQRCLSVSLFNKSYGIVLNNPYSVRMHDGKDKFIDPLTGRMSANRQINWMVHKGDLMASDTQEKDIQWSFSAQASRIFKLPVYTYIHDEEDHEKPDRYETGQHELEEVAKIPFDLTQIPLTDFESQRNPSTREISYTAYMKCLTVISEEGLEFQVLRNGDCLSKTKIPCMNPKAVY
ncbi:hypothetical protein VTL71DRAFT_10892 [Oculimacula yallundae]|uniref:Uncharacterized protein n=1 Tax=Oculimacula yallundae TaxID=86028 RepID=A0ABR4CVS5_9HELO